jgi:outer membrane protein OmpA-like peptidoglycan-associated protein
MLALGASGCATRGYARRQVKPVADQVAALEAKTDTMTEKEATDISRVEEKILSTDNRLTAVADTLTQTQASAAQANLLAQQSQSTIAANRAAWEAQLANVDKSMSYQLVATGDVTFGFNKSELGPADQAALDALISQVQSRPRAQFELLGFTDPVGTKSYNLALSRRRAEAVARYLVKSGIPLRGIHIIGLGEEAVPAGLLVDAKAVDPNMTAADSHRLARRVVIRIYTADASLTASVQ